MRLIGRRLAQMCIPSLLLGSLLWSVEEPLPTVSLDSVWLSQQWQAADQDSVPQPTLNWSEGILIMTLALTPPPGFRIIGQPTARILSAHDASGVDLRLPKSASRTHHDEWPSLEVQPTSFVQVHLRAPVAPFAGLREVTGTCTVHLARNQPKEAVLTPVSAWIDKPTNLADDVSAEFIVRRGEDGCLFIEFSSVAAERFSSLRLTTSDGDELFVDSDADEPDQDNQTITRFLPDNIPDTGILTLRFVGSGDRRLVPFSFSPLALPSPPATALKGPVSIPLTGPDTEVVRPDRAIDGKF